MYDGREPSGSSSVWWAFNLTRENGVLPARLAVLFEPLQLQERRELLNHAHFPVDFMSDKYEAHLRGDGLTVATNVIDEALEFGYPANVLVIQLAQLETLLPFLPERPYKEWLIRDLPELLQHEPSIQDSMRRHEHRV